MEKEPIYTVELPAREPELGHVLPKPHDFLSGMAGIHMELDGKPLVIADEINKSTTTIFVDHEDNHIIGESRKVTETVGGQYTIVNLIHVIVDPKSEEVSSFQSTVRTGFDTIDDPQIERRDHLRSTPDDGQSYDAINIGLFITNAKRYIQQSQLHNNETTENTTILSQPEQVIVFAK